MVNEVGTQVHAVVFHDASKNAGMAETLAAKINNFDGSFPHPCQVGKS